MDTVNHWSNTDTLKFMACDGHLSEAITKQQSLNKQGPSSQRPPGTGSSAPHQAYCAGQSWEKKAEGSKQSPRCRQRVMEVRKLRNSRRGSGIQGVLGVGLQLEQGGQNCWCREERDRVLGATHPAQPRAAAHRHLLSARPWEACSLLSDPQRSPVA